MTNRPHATSARTEEQAAGRMHVADEQRRPVKRTPAHRLRCRGPTSTMTKVLCPAWSILGVAQTLWTAQRPRSGRVAVYSTRVSRGCAT